MPQQPASQYDKIFRENLEIIIPTLIRKLLGIQVVNSEELPDDLQYTKERRPDALKKITDSFNSTFVLHIEFQLADEPNMVFRMAEYYIMLRRQYKLPVKQFVIFLGMSSPKMTTILSEENMQFRFILIPFISVDYTLFSKSHKPEEIVLAILANFNNESSSKVIQEILSGLKQFADTGLNHSRYINQLRILAQMRNLRSQIDFAMDSILPFLKEENDLLYIAGEFKALEKVILNMLQKTDFSDEKIADITGTPLEVVQKVRVKHRLG